MPHARSACETLDDFVELHYPQLQILGVPQKYWPALFSKLKNETLDAGDTFSLLQVEELEGDEAGNIVQGGEVNYTWSVFVTCKNGINVDNPKHIYLVDHAWTYRIEHARVQLESTPRLLGRMANLMDLTTEGKQKGALVQEVLNNMWKYNQTYNNNQGSDGISRSAIWYVLDEFGSRIQHSLQANIRMVPFCYIPTQVTFSIMWPTKDIGEGDEVTRNYVEKCGTPMEQKLRLLPWKPQDFSDTPCEQKEEESPYFNKYKVHESLPNTNVDFPPLPKDQPIGVYTDVELVKELLTDNRFKVVPSMANARVIWTKHCLKNFKSFSEETPGMRMNQFPQECVLTVRDLFAQVSRRKGAGRADSNNLSTTPKWLPTTFNLKTELPKFASYYQNRIKKGLPNYWMVKSLVSTGGQDALISNRLSSILRVIDTGPKLACRYIDSPVLVQRPGVGPVKFDFQFIALLHCTKPLRLSIHSEFVTRFANKAFSLDILDDMEKHSTVVHRKGTDVVEMYCEDFIRTFEAQLPNQKWKNIEGSIRRNIKELFQAATSKDPPKGMAHSPQSRAMYGVDVALGWEVNQRGEKTIQPQILQVNFNPEVFRISRLHPEFVNECFATLFCEDFKSGNIVQL